MMLLCSLECEGESNKGALFEAFCSSLKVFSYIASCIMDDTSRIEVSSEKTFGWDFFRTGMGSHIVRFVHYCGSNHISIVGTIFN
jgi:hypothetical protein